MQKIWWITISVVAVVIACYVLIVPTVMVDTGCTNQIRRELTAGMRAANLADSRADIDLDDELLDEVSRGLEVRPGIGISIKGYESALDVALDRRRMRTAEFCISQGLFNPNEAGLDENIAKNADYGVIDKLVESLGSNHELLIRVARQSILFGRPTVCKKLIVAGIDVDEFMVVGLGLDVWLQRTYVLRWDANKVDSYGNTVQHYAAASNSDATLSMILSLGMDLSARNRAGETPAHIAARVGASSTLSGLFKRGEKQTARLGDKFYPIHLAAMSGEVECLDLCVVNGCDVSTSGVLNLTPLHLSAYLGHVDVIRSILSKGVDVNVAVDQYEYWPERRTSWDHWAGWRPLHFASKGGHPGIVGLLLRSGAGVRTRTGLLVNGTTPSALEIAVDAANASCVSQLLPYYVNGSDRNELKTILDDVTRSNDICRQDVEKGNASGIVKRRCAEHMRIQQLVEAYLRSDNASELR